LNSSMRGWSGIGIEGIYVLVMDDGTHGDKEL
jgi:hypothetical protein